MKKLLTPTIIFLTTLALTYGLVTTFKKPQQSVGVALPSIASVFETSLQTGITSTATSLTLTANSIRGGDTLSGYTCVVLDEGNTNEEQVCGTVSGTAMTGLTRGISYADGVTSVAALKFSHRRGANLKITDAPILQLLKSQNNGESTFVNQLEYESYLTPVDDTDIISKKYADDLAIAGSPDATETVKGISELATQIEMASSTPTGATSANLVLQSQYATSTPTGDSVSGLFTPVTKNNGKLSQLFWDLSEAFTWTGNHIFTGVNSFTGLNTFSATTTMATTTIADLTVSGSSDLETVTSTTWTNSGTASTTDLIVSGTLTGGAMAYTASSTAFSVSSGTTTYTGSIPTTANNGFGKWDVDCPNNDFYGNVTIFETGLTISDIGGADANDDFIYRFTWSGNNLSVQEVSDVSTNCSVSGTMYWYK